MGGEGSRGGRRRLQVTIYPKDFVRLGLDPIQDGAVQTMAAVSRYAYHVHRASLELEGKLTPEEWEYLFRALEDAPDQVDRLKSDLPSLAFVSAAVQSGRRNSPDGDAFVRTLTSKLRGITDIHGDAILAAVRWRSRFGDEIKDGDPWWTVGDRIRCLRGSVRV